MAIINHDEFWRTGAVRIRANAPDPFAGLRGRAYISARRLDKPVGKLQDSKAEAALREAEKNLIKAINEPTADAAGAKIYYLESRSVNPIPSRPGLRFYPTGQWTLGGGDQ